LPKYLNLGGLFDLPGTESRIAELEQQMARPDFWDEPERAQKILKEATDHKRKIERHRSLLSRAKEIVDLIELIQAETDYDMARELDSDLKTLEREIKEYELTVLLRGEYDSLDAILTLHAGAGGTDAQDWVEMLLRMYLRWAERRGYKCAVLDMLQGEEAGLKSVVVSVSGEHAYGFLKAEKGVHRLVRISPFDSSGRRHTSFASCEVLPEIKDDGELEIRSDDLKIDTFRASGAGGQHVNKTDSAVRITHIPTGIIVQCQNERSQHSNKETAMRILRGLLAERREEERAKEMAEIRGEHSDIAWGSQIRSYVFQPYSLVKDHRTGVEQGNVQAVIDGEIDEFIYAFLEQQALGKEPK